MLIAATSLTTKPRSLPPRLASVCSISVVFPAPRKPVMITAGTLPAGRSEIITGRFVQTEKACSCEKQIQKFAAPSQVWRRRS